MKHKERSKALKLYIGGTALYKISKQLKVSQKILAEWRDKDKWKELRKDILEKGTKNVVESIIKQQEEITELAQDELLRRLKEEYPDIQSKELISMMKHGLTVVRPVEHTNNLTVNKNNKTIQVNIPKEVIALIEKENTNGGEE